MALCKSCLNLMHRLLAVYPKSFPMVVLWMEFRFVLADCLVRDGQIDEGERLFAELDRRRQALLDDMPSAARVERIGTTQRSALLVELSRRRPPAEIARQADRLLGCEPMLNAVDGLAGQMVRYKVACV